MTAEIAIEKVKSETTIFLGRTVRKNNYPHQIRNGLQRLCETGKLSPKEYWRVLKITWCEMTNAEKSIGAQAVAK